MENKPILIIEDDIDIRESLEELLVTEGYPVQTASNGQDALTVLSTAQVSPRLILLDLMMPVMDGKTFLQEFANSFPQLKDVNICILTAAGQRELPPHLGPRVRVIRKPLEVDDLLSVVKELC